MVMRKKHTLKITIPIPPHIAPSQVLRALYDHPTVFKHQAYITAYNVISSLKLPEPVKKDCHYFSGNHDGPNNIVSYEVAEDVPMLPGGAKWASKAIKFLVRCQNIDEGVRCQANAPGGVIVRSTYRVVDRLQAKIEKSQKDPFAFGVSDSEKERYGTPNKPQDTDGSETIQDGNTERPSTRNSKVKRPDPIERLRELESQRDREGAWDLIEETEVECNILMLGFVAANMEAAHREICKKILKELENEGRDVEGGDGEASSVAGQQVQAGREKRKSTIRPASYVPPRDAQSTA